MKPYALCTAFLLVATLLISACTPVQPSTEKVKPATVEPVEGSEFSRVILTEKAAERLGIQTVTVSEQELDGNAHKVIPYSAVMYGLKGETWTYTNPETLVFVRQLIVIDKIDGDLVYLSEGPEIGMPVVTVGASLLYGAEVGVSK